MNLEIMLQAVYLLIILFFIIRGARRGLAGELAPLFGLVAGTATAWFGYPTILSLVTSFLSESGATAIFYGSLITFIIALLIFILITKLVRNVLQFVVAQPFNAILGGIIGALKVLFISSLLFGVVTTSQERWNSAKNFVEKSPILQFLGSIWSEHFSQQNDDPLSGFKTNANRFGNKLKKTEKTLEKELK